MQRSQRWQYTCSLYNSWVIKCIYLPFFSFCTLSSKLSSRTDFQSPRAASLSEWFLSKIMFLSFLKTLLFGVNDICQINCDLPEARAAAWRGRSGTFLARTLHFPIHCPGIYMDLHLPCLCNSRFIRECPTKHPLVLLPPKLPSPRHLGSKSQISAQNYSAMIKIKLLEIPKVVEERSSLTVASTYFFSF